MSALVQSPEQRFRESINYMIGIYEWILKDLESKKLTNPVKVNSVLMGIAKKAIEEVSDVKLIETAIEKSMVAWVYAHYYDDVDKKINVTYLRNNFSVFLAELPTDTCEELTRLSLHKDENGNYAITDVVVDKIHQAGLMMVRIALNYLEAKGVTEGRMIKMPFKNRLIEYESKTCTYEKLSYIDVGFWRHLYPAKN